jgi:hypothetical protein
LLPELRIANTRARNEPHQLQTELIGDESVMWKPWGL